MIPLPELTSVTIRYRLVIREHKASGSLTIWPNPEDKREPKEKAPELKQRPER